MTETRWNAITAMQQPDLKALFNIDPDRLDWLTTSVGGLRFDWSKTHMTRELLGELLALAEDRGFTARRDALFSGAAVNITEGRAAEHGAERGEGTADSVARAKMLHNRMRGLVDAIDAGALGEVRHIVHIGIGGSALGPKMLMDALSRDGSRYDVAVVSNVDGCALEEAVRYFDPETTLVAVASKTFTTAETMQNARSVIEWMTDGGVEDPYGRIIALTAAPEKAVEWGVDETRILPFSETVGGRYSLWSSIGFPVALALGWDAFESLLEGAAIMDRHFRLSPPEKNAPLIAACIDHYYVRALGAQTRGLFAYDERLRLLADYLQQLEMESNGKSVKLDGTLVDGPTAPITWGGVGTDAQHAVFQLLHQGTHLVPVEFIASIEQGHGFDTAHHQMLLINCFAQGAALMQGRESDDPARAYPGGRPSTTILMDDVTPAELGALLAFYENRTFANAVLMEINPFDQFGVELGKQIANSIAQDGPKDFDPSTEALIKLAFG
ncbi:MAG: glucose-6-phosphate isomerase [Sphingobium sp.]|nr:glucose-6-phosphate isomerase [Sphingobium sp.]